MIEKPKQNTRLKKTDPDLAVKLFLKVLELFFLTTLDRLNRKFSGHQSTVLFEFGLP